MIGGPLIFTSAVLVMFGAFSQISAWGAVAALPVFVYEMSFAGWLVIKGFNPSAILRLSNPE